MASNLSSVRSRVGFFSFVSLLACLTSATVICFSMALLNEALVYAGIACLVGVVILVVTFTATRYMCRTAGDEDDATTSSRPNGTRDVSGDQIEDIRRREFRCLEREIEELFTEVSELQSNALCSSDVLDRENDNIRREYERVTQWIEGTKIPDDREVEQLIRSLENIRTSLQNVRRRSERITTSLAMRPIQIQSINMGGRSTQGRHSHDGGLSTEGGPSGGGMVTPRPPPYEVVNTTLHPALDPHPYLYPYPVRSSRSRLPSYNSDSRFSMAPPSDDCEAPPPYEPPQRENTFATEV